MNLQERIFEAKGDQDNLAPVIAYVLSQIEIEEVEMVNVKSGETISIPDGEDNRQRFLDTLVDLYQGHGLEHIHIREA
jgi:ABC-type metal ion transport system substrate-binding protein